MRTVTSSEMRLIDEKAIREYGIPGLILMENAGMGAAAYLMEEIKKAGLPQNRILVLCGKGHNGGDGFVMARVLTGLGYPVQVILFANPPVLKPDSQINFQKLEALPIPVTVADEAWMESRFGPFLETCDWIVDAIFGVGLDKPLRDSYLNIVRSVNEARKKVFAVDIPSGLNADTGQIMGEAVCAGWTATLGLAKKGLFTGDGPRVSGKIRVIDIGIPKELLKKM